MKKILSIVIMIISMMCLASCGNDSEDKIEWPFEQKVSYIVEEDGWVYSFSYTYDKGELNDDGLIPYNFMGVNLRYRYNEDYVTTVTFMEDGECRCGLYIKLKNMLYVFCFCAIIYV